MRGSRLWRVGLLGLVALAGCPRSVPEHLQVAPKPAPTVQVTITDVPSALRAIVGRDPLARSPSLPDPKVLEGLQGGAPLAAFVRQVQSAERGQAPMEQLLQQVEDEWRGTAAVPLARGYRLRLAENQLANRLQASEAAEASVVTLITPLIHGIADPTLPRRPLEWLGTAARLRGPDGESVDSNVAGSDLGATVRQYAERWVLSSWLSSPAIPVEVLLEPLAAPQYDSLRTSALGELIVARGQQAGAEGAEGGTNGGTDPGQGLADLRRATSLALTRAAADRDAEQAHWAEQKSQAEAETGDKDPVGALLERAAKSLTASASSDKAAGGALLALGALRWLDRCDVKPCAGLDRLETIGHAARWDPEIAEIAGVWRVVALKETIDSLDVGRDTALFPELATDLADALIGTGASALEAPMLRKQRPDAQTWLVIGRAVGAEGLSDWEGARVALGKHLEAEARRALAGTTEASWKDLLERIAKRAVP